MMSPRLWRQVFRKPVPFCPVFRDTPHPGSRTDKNRYLREQVIQWSHGQGHEFRRAFRRNLWVAPHGATIIEFREDAHDGPPGLAILTTDRFVRWAQYENMDIEPGSFPDILIRDTITRNEGWMLVGTAYITTGTGSKKRLTIREHDNGHIMHKKGSSPGLSDTSSRWGERHRQFDLAEEASHRVIVGMGEMYCVDLWRLSQIEYADMITRDDLGMEHEWLSGDSYQTLWVVEPEPLTLEDYVELMPMLAGNARVWVEET
jgi:hypothetical protein